MIIVDDVIKISAQLNTINNMLISLVELLEEKEILSREEWEKKIKEKEGRESSNL
ncbi:MAG: hypothetical protein ACE5K4_06190 [Candidatus Hydrothermarchaeota archaeon]